MIQANSESVEISKTSMTRQRTNQLPFIIQLQSRYDIFVFEMNLHNTTLKISSLSAVRVPSDNDNVNTDKDNEDISNVKIRYKTNLIVCIDSKALNTLRNYSTTCVHTRLFAHVCSLSSISINIDARTYLTCSRNSTMEEQYNDIIFDLIE